jgi:hypothetical protein
LKIQAGNELGTLICGALGLDVKCVTRIDIHCKAGEAALATVHLCIDRGAKLEEVVKLYRLVPLNSPQIENGEKA